MEKLRNVTFYKDHLDDAVRAGYSSLSEWITALHTIHKANALHVGIEVGVSRGTMICWFRKLDLRVLGKGGYNNFKNHPRRSEVGKIYRQMKSTPKVAKELGVSRGTITNWLKADGIPLIGKPGRYQ